MMGINHLINSNVLIEETVISWTVSYKLYQVMNSENFWEFSEYELMQSGIFLSSHELRMWL